MEVIIHGRTLAKLDLTDSFYAEPDHEEQEVVLVGPQWQIRLPMVEGEKLFESLSTPSADGDDDDLDDLAERDVTFYERMNTARELLIALLKQCDPMSLLDSDEFATSVAQRAAFLAGKLHDALDGRGAAGE